MDRIFMKGSEAIAEAAVRAGCRFFAGYPITPQNEIPEYFARRMPEVDGVFVQGESEVASINMVWGAASTGTRSMTSSSSCGIALKTEGISYMAGSRIPAVICSVMRGGPGVGSIQPAQQDYLQATKAMGNGGFRLLVFAPSTVQEAVDMTYKAFDYAETYRTPVVILSDGVTAIMMETVELPPQLTPEQVAEKKALCAEKWALVGKPDGRPRRLITSGGGEQMNIDAAAMYEKWAESEVRVEEIQVEDAQVVIAAYGISARIASSAVSRLREEGYRVGLIRPITVSPFPYDSFKKLDPNQVESVLDVEMSIPAQMIEDVKLGLEGRIPVHTCLRSCGELISVEMVIDAVKSIYSEGTR